MSRRRTILSDALEHEGESLLEHAALTAFAAVISLSVCLSVRWAGLLAAPTAAILAILLIPFLRRRADRFVVIVLGIVIGLAFSEGAYRLRYFGLESLSSWKRFSPVGVGHVPGFLRVSEDEVLGFEITPGFHGTIKGAYVSINSDGFRDREFRRQSDRGCRIVVTGDSFTMGSGTEQDLTYSRRLESILRAEPRTAACEVFNLGVGAYGLTQMADNALRRGLDYDPDLILYAVRPQAITQRVPPEPPDWSSVLELNHTLAEQMSFPRRYSFVVNLLPGQNDLELLLRRVTAPRANEDSAGERPLLLDASLERLRDELAPRQVLLAAVILRNMYFGDDGASEERHRRIRERCRAVGVHCIDTWDAFPPESRALDLIIYPGDNHPNAAAHEIYARHIASRLAEWRPWASRHDP